MKIEAGELSKTSPEETNQSLTSNEKRIIEKIDRTPPLWFSKRFTIAVVIFICNITNAIITTNINIAVVEMTSNKSIVTGNLTSIRPAEFQWDPSVIGIVSSSQSYGGLFCVFGGFFFNKLGGSVGCSFAIMVYSILTLLQPTILYLDFRLFLVLRLLIGFFTNCFYVCTAEIYSRWFPQRERSMLTCFCYTGTNVGVFTMYSLFGYIADRLGWQMVFYVSGVTSLATSLLCLIAIRNGPSQDKWITKEELSYILNETHYIPPKQVSHPYTKILTSPAVWALCLASFAWCWLTTLLGSCIPLYAKDLTGRSTDEIGLISSIPGSITIVINPLLGTLKDYWKNHSNIGLTKLDKIIIIASFLSTSVLFIACAIFSNFTASIVIFFMIFIVKAMILPVLEPNVVNIAPNDSSIVAGLVKFSQSISGIVSRTLVGFMTINHSSQEWNNCFLLASGVSILGMIVFVKYGSSEAQPWSLSSDTDEEYDYLIKSNRS